MTSKRQRDYIERHKEIREKLMECIDTDSRGCVNVSQLASQLKMDIRTVRSHLEIMEADLLGVFMDASKKQFCTKEGLSLLAEVMKRKQDDAE